MARPALTQEERRAIRRNIRQAAAELHAENGLSNISVRAVAKKAGVSVGTVYSYFGSLSELMQSLWRQPARKLVQEMSEIAHEIDSPAERLRTLLHAYVQFSVNEPQVFRSAFLFVRPESLEPPEQIDLADDRFFTLFTDAIKQGQEDGQFRDGDPDYLAQMIISAVHGSLALPVNLHRLGLHDGIDVAKQSVSAQLEWLQTQTKP